MTREQKKQKRREVLTIIGMMASLVFITRLWPILLLMIIGVFAYALWLLFYLEKKPEPTMQPPLLGLPAPVTEETVLADAFTLLQRRITEQVANRYPDARWVWGVSDARDRFERGGELVILLNGAGGYRGAVVQVNRLQCCGLAYTVAEQTPSTVPEEESEEDETLESQQETVDYGLLAFEWVDANLQDLNTQCNEAIAQGRDSFRILASQLPHGDSWPLICKELLHNGFATAEPLADGIQVQIKIR